MTKKLFQDLSDESVKSECKKFFEGEGDSNNDTEDDEEYESFRRTKVGKSIPRDRYVY